MHLAEPELAAAARRLFAYLSECDPLPRGACDAIIGFGVFDLALARHCGDLFRQGRGRHIIFTGGIGAGTGNLGRPEAVAWREELRRSHPDIAEDAVILEDESTNTGENIAFTAQLLRQRHPELRFGEGIRSAVLVASPSRMRRVWLSMRRQQPHVQVFRHAPSPHFERELALYAEHRVGYAGHLVGEVDRILDYGTRGWIEAEPLPAAIAAAHLRLKSALRPRPAP